jgi:hypothetical protein
MACDNFCCVAKRFDRPFLRLPEQAPLVTPDTNAVSPPLVSPGADVERRLASDSDTGAVACAETATPVVSCAMETDTHPTYPGKPDAEEDSDDSDETETEEAATRVRLAEILNTIACGDGKVRDGVTDGVADEHVDGVDVDTTGRDLGEVNTLDAHKPDVPPENTANSAHNFLSDLAHLSHRRERHCRKMLQHSAAEQIVNAAADALAGSTDKQSQEFALAALLMHNLSIAASLKEPRDDDDRDPDDEARYQNEALEKDGYSKKMLSVVTHGRWPEIVRDVFGQVERLAVAELAKNPFTEHTGEDEPVLCVPVESAYANELSPSDRADAEHKELCRGALGTATAALLALLEPDSARPRLLAMDDGAFVLRVFKTMTSILPKRHGDAALDAVGIMHRVLWLRPDATAEEQNGLAKALVLMEENGDGKAACVRTGEHNVPGSIPGGTEDLDTKEETEKRSSGGESAHDVKSAHDAKSAHDEQVDPDDLWDWNSLDGYLLNPKKGREKFHPFRWHPVFDDERHALAKQTSMQAEQVSINGLIAGLRTHLPDFRVGKCGSGNGAAGGTAVCTQAVHVLRGMYRAFPESRHTVLSLSW